MSLFSKRVLFISDVAILTAVFRVFTVVDFHPQCVFVSLILRMCIRSTIQASVLIHSTMVIQFIK